MKTIAALTVAATLASVAINRSSAGGPLTALLIDLLGMWAVGAQQAYANNRGALGWVGSIALSFVGGLAALAIGSVAMETLLSAVHFQGSLAQSNHPLLYVMSASLAIFVVLGSWCAIQIMTFFGGARSSHAR